MADLIVIAVLAVIMAAAGRYIYKAKKSGRKCIGCPEGCCSSRKDGCSCSCGSEPQ